jgi:hypothetical protein
VDRSISFAKGVIFSDESLPQLTKAPISVQAHIKRLDERMAKGKALEEKALHQAQAEWKLPANAPIHSQACKKRRPR